MINRAMGLIAELLSRMSGHSHTGADGSAQITGAAMSVWAGTGDIADVVSSATGEGAGTATTVPRGDHKHQIAAASIKDADVAADAAIAVSKSKQYEFIVFLGTSTSNDKTGDGTAYTVPFTSEAADDGAAFATDTFTAPVTGKYQLCTAVYLVNIGAGHTDAVLQIVTSNRTYRGAAENAAATRDGTNLTLACNVLADMDANDTAYVQLTVSGSTKTIGVVGSTTLVTYFTGFLAA